LKPAFELAQVIERFGKGFIAQHSPNAYLQRTLSALQRCRTAALGGHKDQCDTCGHIRISYNSCRNRHCPKCQNTHREAWIEDRKRDLLPVPYFHIVFTVPDMLNAMFLQHPEEMYNLLFRSVWRTVEQFAYSKRHWETGMFAVLHTWGQNMSLHPHIHCVIPGGGIDYKGQWQQVPVSANGKTFLFHVQNLSAVFRGKFIEAFKKSFLPEEQCIRKLYRNEWVVYSKEAFGGPAQVVEYLGRYTHKVAISNHRILNIQDKDVIFRWRDYRDDNKEKVMTLSGAEFLRRFCMHFLPKGFVRIRHYGLLSTTKRPLLRQVQQLFGIHAPQIKTKKSWKQLCREHLNYNPDSCPVCGKGKMINIEGMLPARGPPPTFLLSPQQNNK
jgi:hypothetical protein